MWIWLIVKNISLLDRIWSFWLVCFAHSPANFIFGLGRLIFSISVNSHPDSNLLYRMKPRKHIHVKYCCQAYFKSIGTLSQTFKNNIHNNKEIQDQYPTSSSDVFLSKNDNSGGKTREASEGVWSMIFISQNMIFVLCDHVFWCLPIVQSN